MIETIIRYSAKNRFLVFLVMIFATAWGLWAISNITLDAIPDLSDVQVIVFTEWPGRSPDLVEDQITYPIVAAMLSAPNVQLVRGISQFGYSYVYIIFEDGTEMYWARSRILEYLQKITGQLPEGTNPILAPMLPGWDGSLNTPWLTKAGATTWHNFAPFRIGICVTGWSRYLV